MRWLVQNAEYAALRSIHPKLQIDSGPNLRLPFFSLSLSHFFSFVLLIYNFTITRDHKMWMWYAQCASQTFYINFICHINIFIVIFHSTSVTFVIIFALFGFRFIFIFFSALSSVHFKLNTRNKIGQDAVAVPTLKVLMYYIVSQMQQPYNYSAWLVYKHILFISMSVIL